MIKKGISTFAAGVRRCTAAAAAAAFVLAAAPSLACAAGSVSLEKGAAVQLSSQVSLDGEYEVSTNWSVTGAESADTSIDDNGFLTIGEDETASALTVVAAMTVTRTGSDGAETVETYSDSTTVIVTAPGAPDEEEEETGADPALVGGAKEDAAQPTTTPAPSESPRPAETNSSTSDTLLPEQKVEVPEAAAPQDGAAHTVESVQAADPQTGDMAEPGLYGGILAAVLAIGGILGMRYRKTSASSRR